MTKNEKLLKLFITMLYISSFTFGGGFVIVTLMKRHFVDELDWMNEEEMLDITALAESSPGAIAVNAAILVGWKIGGFVGMLVAVLGTIIPPMVILSVISFFYSIFVTNRIVGIILKGMQAGVAAVIFDVSISMGMKVVKQRNLIYMFILIATFIANTVFHINVIYIIITVALLGVLMAFIPQKEVQP